MILTCLVPIMMTPSYDETRPLESVDTAVTGQVIAETQDSVLLDFGPYATKHKYDTRATKIWVYKDLCTEGVLK